MTCDGQHAFPGCGARCHLWATPSTIEDQREREDEALAWEAWRAAPWRNNVGTIEEERAAFELWWRTRTPKGQS